MNPEDKFLFHRESLKIALKEYLIDILKDSKTYALIIYVPFTYSGIKSVLTGVYLKDGEPYFISSGFCQSIRLESLQFNLKILNDIFTSVQYSKNEIMK